MLKWLYKLFGKSMSYYLDPKKIQAKIEQLNIESLALNKIQKPKALLPTLTLSELQEERDIWEEVPGLYWYDEVVRQKITDPVTLMPSGILLKLFANKKTGEFRSFSAKLFE